MILHGFFRSSASWRVRIALNLKGLPFEQVTYRLREGDQRNPDFLARNPQGLVPALELDGGQILTQSLAIIDYLDAIQPFPPLLPENPLARARVRAFSLAIAADIHPIQNLKILNRLTTFGVAESDSKRWAAATIDEGFDACEALLSGSPGPFCFGESVTLADICLVPQIGNARRFDVPMRWPRLEAAAEACQSLAAFADAAPDRQPDAA